MLANLTVRTDRQTDRQMTKCRNLKREVCREGMRERREKGKMQIFVVVTDRETECKVTQIDRAQWGAKEGRKEGRKDGREKGRKDGREKGRMDG